MDEGKEFNNEATYVDLRGLLAPAHGPCSAN